MSSRVGGDSELTQVLFYTLQPLEQRLVVVREQTRHSILTPVFQFRPSPCHV